MKLTRQLIILVLVMPRRFRKALMDFTGAKTYEECLSRITIISKERIENIAVTFGIPEDCVVCLICNARHKHGYAAKIRKWDGSYHIGYIADAKNNGCKTLHFDDHMGNGNRNAEHDHDGPPPKSKKSINEATCPSTERYFAMIIISLWWVRIQRRRRSKIKKHSVCRMFMKLKAYKRLRSIYKAKKQFEQKRQAFEMLCKQWQKKKEQMEKERLKKKKGAFLDHIRRHRAQLDRERKH